MKKIILTLILAGIILGSGYLAMGAAEGILVIGGAAKGERVLPIGPDGTTLFVDLSKPSGFAWRNPSFIVNPVEIIIVPGFTTITNQPLATTELNVGWREQFDLTNATKVRIVSGVNATGTGVIGIQYFNGSWTWLDGFPDISSVTSTTAQPNTIPLTSKGLQTTAWFNLPADAQRDVTLRVVGSGGDGVKSPQIANLRLQIR